MNNTSTEVYLRRIQGGGGKGEHYMRLALRYALMLLATVVAIGPFLWLFYLSVRMHGNIYSLPKALSDFSFESYKTVFENQDILNAFKSSVLVAIMSVVLTTVIASLAAYPLARYDFYGRNIIFGAMIATLMIPGQLTMIPLYLLVARTLGLSNTWTGVVLPFSASVFGIYLICQFYTSIPRDMEEAARIDGAGEFRLWWQVMLPLTKPAVATLAIFTFVSSWSGFLWPLIILTDPQKVTLPVALATLSGVFVDRISYLAAGSVVAIAPVILFFLFLQRWFLGGMTVGAVKG